MGEIKGSWLEEEQKIEILAMTQRAKQSGVSMVRVCALLMISRRRIVRWRSKCKRAESLGNLKPGPREPLHKLLPVERDAVLQMATKEEYTDLSHRILAVTAWDMELFFVSFSSVYRIMRSAHLMSMRGVHRSHNGRSVPPVRKVSRRPPSRSRP